MAKSVYVVVKIPIHGLSDEDIEELHADTLGFLADNDLFDEGTVESITEIGAGA